MGKYIIELTDLAKEHLQKHKKTGNKTTLKKITSIFEELENHPFQNRFVKIISAIGHDLHK
jgi:toxin YoeB